MSVHEDGTFSFGWNAEEGEFVLWKRDKRFPVAFISLKDGIALATTVHHVAAQEAKSPTATP